MFETLSHDSGCGWHMLKLPLFSSIKASTNTSFRIGRESKVLSSIHEPGINVAVWKRGIREQLATESASWAVHAHEFESIVDVHGSLPEGLLSELPAGSALLADIGFLLKLFIGLSQASRVQLFFGAVRNDQCRKFHQDYVRLRLINTYLGPGTQWVPEDAVRRQALEQPDSSVARDNLRIVPDPSLVRHAQPGEVIVLKGTRYPGNERGAIHRSPPIANLGLTRVVLVLTTYDK